MHRVRYNIAIAAVAVFLMAARLAGQQAPDHQIQVFGQKIHYLESGSGPVVILLHGLGGDATNWAQTLPALAKNYRVVVPDQIGFGQSDKPLMNYRVATLVDFLDEFCNKLGIAKASLVGNSLGGWTAMAFTLAHPEKVDRLILVDSAGYSPARLGGPKPAREQLLALNPSTLEGTRQLMMLIFYHHEMITDAFAREVLAARLKKNDGYTIDRFIDSILRGEDMVDGKLGAVKAPTLIIWGRQDALIGMRTAEALNQDIAGSKLAVLEECGHVPQMECAAGFHQALVPFLAGGS